MRGWFWNFDSTDYDSLKSYLAILGNTVITLDDSFFIPRCDILIIRCGDTNSTYDFTEDEIRAIQNFVYEGGTLVAIAEHGLGIMAMYSDELNHALSDSVGWRTGLRFRPDFAWDPVYGGYGTPKIFIFEDHPYSWGIDTIKLGFSPSISTEPPAKPLMFGSSTLFTIDTTDTDTCFTCNEFLGLSHHGIGSIIAIPDYSIWIVKESLSYSIFDECDNKILARNVFDCSIPPRFRLIPACGEAISCQGVRRDSITVEVINGFDAIEGNSLLMELDGEIFDTSSSELELSSLTAQLQFPPLMHGDTLTACIDTIRDEADYWEFGPYCWEFYVDQEPPVVLEYLPCDGCSLTVLGLIEVVLTDSIAGLDKSTAELTVNDSLTFYPGTHLEWQCDTLVFDPYFAGIWPSSGGSLSLHLEIADTIVLCDPNIGVFDWTIHLPPAEISETPIPGDFELRTYPNPFNSSVAISLSVIPGLIRNPEIEIFDVNGRRVSVISSEGLQPDEKSPTYPQEVSPFGRNDSGREVIWTPAPALGSGVYLVRVKIGSNVVSKRIVYLK